MKNRLFLCVVVILVLLFFYGCGGEGKIKVGIDVLQNAVCRADVRPGEKFSKGVIIGDSIAIHNLVRWTYWIHFASRDWKEIRTANIDENGCDFVWRDTLNNLFYFKGNALFYTARTNIDFGGLPERDTLIRGWLLEETDVIFFVAERNEDTGGYKDPLGEYVWNNHISYDTLGYLKPSEMIRNAEQLLKMFDEQRFEEMLDILGKDYHIYTGNGDDYRELVRLGLN